MKRKTILFGSRYHPVVVLSKIKDFKNLNLIGYINENKKAKKNLFKKKIKKTLNQLY